MYTSVGLILFHRITNSFPICVVALATCLPSAALAARLDARGLGVVVPPARTVKRCFLLLGRLLLLLILLLTRLLAGLLLRTLLLLVLVAFQLVLTKRQIIARPIALRIVAQGGFVMLNRFLQILLLLRTVCFQSRRLIDHTHIMISHRFQLLVLLCLSNGLKLFDRSFAVFFSQNKCRPKLK